MNLEEMKKHEWIVAWSGGKDSTATIILMHEHGIPIKEIIYVRMMYDDTLPATLPVMTEFVDSAKAVFESWGYPVRIVKSRKTAKDLIEQKYVRSSKESKNGHCYGVTAFARGCCTFTTIKCNTVKALINNDYEMIGYAADETSRTHRLGGFKQSIMVELGINEIETFDICRKYNLLSPLYELGFARDGCWFCPNATVKQRMYLKQNNPELVEEIIKMIEMCDYDISSMVKRNHWVEDWLKEKELYDS